MRTLHLTLKKQPFEVMVTGEKRLEFRKNSNWMRSRVIGKNYDVGKFVNGYGADKPYFIAEYLGWYIEQEASERKYSNGLIVLTAKYDIIIQVGKILETGNLSKPDMYELQEHDLKNIKEKGTSNNG